MKNLMIISLAIVGLLLLIQGLETWVIKATNYKELNNVFIPTAFDVLWRLDKGDFSYAKFNITEVEYGKPEKF